MGIIVNKVLLLGKTFSPGITLLSDAQLDTLTLRQRYPWLGSLANNENVAQPVNRISIQPNRKDIKNIPGSESTVQRILDMHNVKASSVLLPMHNNTRAPHVTSTGDHDEVSSIKLDEIRDFVLFNVELDRVVDLDEGVGVADGAAIVGHNVRHCASAECDFAYFEELVGRFLGGDAVDREAAFDIVQQAEVLARFLDGNHICPNLSIPSSRHTFKEKRTHKASRVGRIRTNFSVNLDEALVDDGGNFPAVQRIL